jgi:hypothetical protein
MTLHHALSSHISPFESNDNRYRRHQLNRLHRECPTNDHDLSFRSFNQHQHNQRRRLYLRQLHRLHFTRHNHRSLTHNLIGTIGNSYLLLPLLSPDHHLRTQTRTLPPFLFVFLLFYVNEAVYSSKQSHRHVHAVLSVWNIADKNTQNNLIFFAF